MWNFWSRSDRRRAASRAQSRPPAAARHRRARIEPLEGRALLAPLINTGTAADVVYTLPASANAVFLEDDGTSGNSMLQLRSGNGTFDTTVFANPTGSLTINRGSAFDTLIVNSLPDFNAGLILGSVANSFSTFSFGGEVSLATNKSLTAYSAGSINVAGATSAINTKGIGAISLITKRNIVLASDARMSTEDGDLLLSANQQSPTTAGDFSGLIVSGMLTTSGKGKITLVGNGGNDSLASGHLGINLLNGVVRSTGITADAGKITLTGGVGIGIIGNDGIVIQGAAANIESVAGAIAINGFGGDGSGALNRGVVINGSRVQSLGIDASAANVSILGVGGRGTDSNSGVSLDSGALISTVDGDLFVGGQASNLATGSFNYGTYLSSGSTVRSIGSGESAGDIQINGGGGGTGQSGSNQNQGVRIEGTATTVESANGDLRLFGRGGNALTETNTFADGVQLANGPTLQVTGLGSLGIGGETVATNGNLGVGLRLAGKILASSGSHELAANRMVLDPANLALNLGSSFLTIRPLYSGISVNLGSVADNTAGTLELSDAELDTVTANLFVIGAENSGPLTISSNLTRVSPTSFNMFSGGDISFTAGGIDTAGGSLYLSPDALGGVNFANPGNDVAAGNVSGLQFADTSTLRYGINGLTPDTQYDQLQVSGLIDLDSVNLQLAGTYQPLIGDSFVLIDIQGSNQAIGVFTGLPEGTIFTTANGSINGTFRITYQGGDGNDVVVTAVDPLNPNFKGTPGDDDWLVVRNGLNLEVTLNSALVFSRTFATVASIAIDGQAGNDTLTIDLESDDAVPSNGIVFHGGPPNAGLADRLIINGGSQGTVTYNYTNGHDGSVVMSNFGTVNYFGLEPISNTGSAANVVFNLPDLSATTTNNSNPVLEDDGTSGNGMSRLRSGNGSFETTAFINPNGTVTINRGNTGDALTVNSLPDLNASLTIGSVGSEFSTVAFAGGVTLAANNNLTVDAIGTISLPASTSDLSVSGTGAITLTTARNISLASGSSVASVDGSITLAANAVATTTGNFVGVDINGAVVQATGAGTVSVMGTGGDGAGGSQYGVQVRSGGDILGGASGMLTVSGTGGPGAGDANYGILVIGMCSTISSGGANVQLSGQGGGSGTSSYNYGVDIQTSGQVTAGGSGTVAVQGTGGANAGGFPIGVIVAGATITSSGGNVQITGFGGGSGTSTNGYGVDVQTAGQINPSYAIRVIR